MRVYRTLSFLFLWLVVSRVRLYGFEHLDYPNMGVIIYGLLDSKNLRFRHFSRKFSGRVGDKVVSLLDGHRKKLNINSVIRLSIRQPIRVLGIPIMYRGVDFVFPCEFYRIPGTNMSVFRFYDLLEEAYNKGRNKKSSFLRRSRP